MQIGALNKFGKSVCVPHEKIRFDGCFVVGFTAPADTVFAIADMPWGVGHDGTVKRNSLKHGTNFGGVDEQCEGRYILRCRWRHREFLKSLGVFSVGVQPNFGI